MIKIACVGDNVVDINYIDGIVNPGGNCVNVAVYCSQMGHKAAYVGVLADDDYAKGKIRLHMTCPLWDMEKPADVLSI